MASCEKLCHTCVHWLPYLAQMPRLRALGVGVRDKGIKVLPLLRQLTHLDLQQSSWIESEHIRSLAALTDLRSLSLDGCRGVKQGPFPFAAHALSVCGNPTVATCWARIALCTARCQCIDKHT